MKKLLKECCSDIFSGQAFAGRIINDLAGDCRVIQMRDLNKAYTKIENSPHLVKSDVIPPKQILKPGDILFIAKGSNNKALVFDKDWRAVASSVFFVLRPDQSMVNPFFLAIQINSTHIQNKLAAMSEGTSVRNINKNVIEELKLSIPPLNTQNKLHNLYKLWQIEKNINLKLLKMKDKFFENLMETETENSPNVPAFTDRYEDWSGYWILSNYCVARTLLNAPFLLKGHAKPESEFVGIISHIQMHQRTVKLENGSSVTYPAVKEWYIVEYKNLKQWNDTTIPQEEKKEKYLNVIPHSLIKQFIMTDRFGNPVEYQK